jgi:hypothetical protein
MRRIRVDAARVRESAKHGGRAALAEHSTAVDLDQIADVSSGRDRELIAMDETLVLAQMDPWKTPVVELRFKPTPFRFAASAFAGFVKIRRTCVRLGLLSRGLELVDYLPALLVQRLNASAPSSL